MTTAAAAVAAARAHLSTRRRRNGEPGASGAAPAGPQRDAHAALGAVRPNHYAAAAGARVHVHEAVALADPQLAAVTRRPVPPAVKAVLRPK